MGYKPQAITGSLKRKLFGCFLLVFLCVTTVFSQTSPERYVVDHWATEDGLPVNTVNEVTQSRDGYIWIATFDGLVRFDGLQFKIFDTGNYPTLTSNRILRVIELNDGSLWLLTEQGFLVRYQNGQMERVDQFPEFRGKRAVKLFVDHRNRLWIGSDRGLYLYNNGSLKPYKPDLIKGYVDKIYVTRSGAIWYRNESLNILRFYNGRLKTMAKTSRTADYNTMFQATGGTLFLSTWNALYRFKGDSLLARYPEFEGNSAGIAFHQEPDGDVLMGTIANGIYRFRDGNFNKIQIPAQSSGLYNQSFHRDEKGNLWKISRRKIYKNDQLVYRSNASIRSFTFDEEGSIWLATQASGLIRLKPSILKVYSKAQGLPGENIYPIAETNEGRIWFGTHSNGLARLYEGRIETEFTFTDRHPKQSIRALFQQADGTLLVGLHNYGMYRLMENTSDVFTPIEAPKLLQESTIFSIFEDSGKRLWVGSEAGLFVRENNRWDHYTQKGVLPSNLVRYATEAHDGSIWFATNGGGIVQFLDGKFTTFDTDHGLLSNLVREIHIEPGSSENDYVLWIGTEGRGLNRIPIRNGRWYDRDITYYDESAGLFDNSVHRILDDDLGYFWMSSNSGIFRVAKTDLDAFHRGDTSKIRSVGYTERDGLLNREANGGIQPAGIKASDGRLWFPTQDGAVVVDPANIQSNKTPPPVVIETATSDNQTVWNGNEARLELTTGQRDFEIKYTALSLLVPTKNRFRYKLEGFDEQWRSVEHRRTAFYTNIPPGEYTFRVIGSNNSGVWNETGASLEVQIPPYFYETTWFYGLCLVSIILMIFVGIKYRTRHLAEAERKLKRLVKERTNELRREKKKTEEQAEKLKKLDEVKSRFFANISHEFRTPLTLIINPLKQMVSGALGSFSEAVSKRHDLMLRNSYRLLRLIDQLLDLSRLEEGRVRVNTEGIELVTFTEQICELFEITAGEKDIELTVHSNCDECRVWADRDKMEKIISNLISNAIKYTEPGGSVDVSFGEKDDHCTIDVCDTGVGISKEEQPHIFDRFYQVENSDVRGKEGAGVGLAVVREFVELQRGEIFFDSEEGKGTCFTVVLKKDNAPEPGNRSVDEKGTVVNGDELSVSYLPEIDSIPDPVSKTDLSAPEDDKTSILVVEDHTDLRNFLVELLSNTYRVFEAENGQTALDMIHEELPDLIVADIMMPGMDGRTLNSELKKDPAVASIPLIFLTAKAADEEKIKGYAEGADDYLTKPFEAEVLLARIENLLESRKRLRKLILEEAKEEIDHTDETTDVFLQELNAILEKSFGDPKLSIISLANKMHVDRSHLYRKLKAKTEMTPQQYVLQFRLRKAAKLFKAQRGSVSEVAYASGFNSLSYFAEQFREQFGMNPSEFLAELQV